MRHSGLRHVARVGAAWPPFSAAFLLLAGACAVHAAGTAPGDGNPGPEDAGAPTAIDSGAASDAAPPPSSADSAGSADATGPDCSRAIAARTASTTLFDSFISDESALTA